jgi:hypothetical protein
MVKTYRPYFPEFVQCHRYFGVSGRNVLAIDRVIRYTVEDQKFIWFRPSARGIIYDGTKRFLVVLEVLNGA